ncbi:alpha/beta hydrolase [Roseimaritima ulvae]|uniref:Phospholipase/Carboxylesterase n=1 Tax=Roseimaritima ulvae TaxID=980254 RepID=A0A5B9QY78_9BACT|nr:PHB depolymerase family esterase [Roseimaritima ulvae]QEG42800.1 Phospholipase/Carboxylesterase [Roseimaritima ulvae]
MNRLPSSDTWNTQTEITQSKGRQPQLSPFPSSLASNSPNAFFVPARYEKNYAYPLVVWLHHDGATEQQVSQVLPHVSVQNYVGVGIRGSRAADAAGHRYDWVQTAGGIAQAEQSVMDAIENASQRYSIHPERVFIAGYKAGGTMAQRIALRCPSQFAGVISLGGGFPGGCRPLANLQQARELNMWMAFATECKEFSLDAMTDDLRLLNAAKMRVEVQQLEASDEMLAPVLRQVDQWIMSLVTGQTQPRCVPDWDTVPVEFSAN